MATKIPYVDETWNTTVGCTRVSAGCDNCWAYDFYHLFEGAMTHSELLGILNEYDWTGKVELCKWRLRQPLHWKRPRRILVNATSDLFHKQVPTSYLKEVFAIVQQCPQHTFLGLTKRPRRAARLAKYTRELENWWVGVSVENQRTATRRLEIASWIPAKYHWASIEPLLEGIWLPSIVKNAIDWIVIGAESGSNRRPCDLEWVRGLVKQCCSYRIPVYIKQLDINGKCNHHIEEWPVDLRIQNLPTTKELK